MHKFACYVDETGQDTAGAFYLVSVVVTEYEREELHTKLEAIEQETGKHKRKWNKAKKEWRMAYIRRILSEPGFRGRLHFGVSQANAGYVDATIQTTAEAILCYAQAPYKATVFVDGLSRSEERIFTNGLKRRRIRTEKVRGLEENAFIRLADALCGFLREVIAEENVEYRRLMARGIKDGYLIEVREAIKTPVSRGNSLVPGGTPHQ
jgi:hypothetical protein